MVPTREKEHVDVNAKDSSGHFALTRAAFTQQTDIVRYLLSLDELDVNLQNTNGNTAMHLAARMDHRDVVRLLLEDDRTDFTLRNNMGRTAFNESVILGSNNVCHDWLRVQFLF